MARVTKSVEERRQEIIDTAREMFMENGFDKTQMADISKRMNVAAGTIYHYFNSKTELLYAVIDEITEQKMQEKRQQLTKTEDSAYVTLKSIFTSFGGDKEYWNMDGGLTDDPAIIQYYLTRLSDSLLPLLTSLIEQGNADGSLSCEYPAETALFLLQGLTGLASSEQRRKESQDERSKRMRALGDIILRVFDTMESS